MVDIVYSDLPYGSPEGIFFLTARLSVHHSLSANIELLIREPELPRDLGPDNAD